VSDFNRLHIARFAWRTHHSTPMDEWEEENDLFRSTNIVRKLSGTNWSDYAILPEDMVDIRAAGGLFFGMPYSGCYTPSSPSPDTPIVTRVSSDLSVWQDTDLPASRVREPYRFFYVDEMWGAELGTNFYVSADGISWRATPRPVSATGPIVANAAALYVAENADGLGYTPVHAAMRPFAVTTNYTSETVTLPLWGDWQGDVDAKVSEIVPQAVAEATGGLATEEYVNERIAAIPEPSPYLPQLNTTTNLAVRLVTTNDWIMAIGEIQ
ncbi:MAG TPA: hypothetical protein P5026_07605, partial [Kiritimatiellia bacterium]|nr:hypothetical protein [Kiritimatiellia bacterium]HRU70948.1 hypothetical protein [Kiritimatiellia bacterium]